MKLVRIQTRKSNLDQLVGRRDPVPWTMMTPSALHEWSRNRTEAGRLPPEVRERRLNHES